MDGDITGEAPLSNRETLSVRYFTPLSTQHLVELLREAVAVARQLGRSDIVHRLEGLIDRADAQPRGGRRVSSPVQLRTVGPMVKLSDWIAEVQAALANFEQEVLLAHSEDPVNFPIERTAADWYAELGQRMEKSAPSAHQDPDDEC